ncbi:MAG: peptidoglycan DD-metalloendopeptidase family protein [Candidatus Fimadaptatus sp.]
MATERSSDTVVRVYTSRRPPEQEDEYVKRGGRDGRGERSGRTEGEGARPRLVRLRFALPDMKAFAPLRRRREAAPRHARRVRPARSARRTARPRGTYMERMSRDALIVCALLLGVASVRALPFEWAQQATQAMSSAVNMSVDLDKTLGQLQFVREVIPESAMVFWHNASGGEYAAPFEGDITHSFSAGQPWLEYAGQSQAVKAARAGSVRQLEQGEAGDWAVRLEHEGGMETVYAFLSGVSVRVGDSVAAAQEIGRADGANGARIYFEMRINGESVDPSAYLGIK